jgi:hypothetical protein
MSLARNLTRLFPNASGLLPNANIEAMAASKLTGQVPDANAPSGSVIQVVQAVKTDVSVIYQGPTEVPGLSLNITPTSASNKILLMWTVQYSSNDHSALLIYRGSTAVAVGNQIGSNRPRVTHQSYAVASLDEIYLRSGQFLDSPSTTSSINYRVMSWGNNDPAYFLAFNRTRNNIDRVQEGTPFCSITAMEIAA